jgi:serine/threonine kinase PknH
MGVASLFIATDRSSAEPFAALAADAMALGYAVEWDRDLPGGDAWWAGVLDAVERADAFVYALTSSSLASSTCQEQLRFALALGKPILPVLLGGDLSDVDLPPSLGQIQRVDYRAASSEAMAQLFSALRGMALQPPPLAPPLRPDCPPELALDIEARLASPTDLSRQEQDAILAQLARYVADGFSAPELDGLMSRLHERRPDMTVLASNRLDELEAQLAGATPPPPTVPRSTGDRAPQPDGHPPVRRLFLSYSR